MNRKLVISAVSLIILIAASAGLGFWYASNRDDEQKEAKSSITQNQSGSSTTPDSNQTTPKTYTVSVYFSKHSESDNDPGATFPVKRTSPDLGVAKYAITQLLLGPTSSEKSQGYFTTAKLRSGTSTCNGADFKVTINGDTAKLQFCKPFDHLGVVADGQADSEIKATLKQFAGVKKVIILNTSGNCEFDLSGQNLCLQQ